MRPDFALVDCSTIVILCPLSGAAVRWLQAHIGDEALWLERSVVIEARFLRAILEAVRAARLRVSRERPPRQRKERP